MFETIRNTFITHWWIFLICGVGLILVVLALFVLRKLKNALPAKDEDSTTVAITDPVTQSPVTQGPVTQGPAIITSQSNILIGNAHHIGSRDSQQDSFCISDIFNADLFSKKGVLGVVADGMGGMADGAEISSIVTRTMLQYFNEIEFSPKTELDLLNMLYAANDNVNKFLDGRDKGGSTVVAVIIRDGNLFWVAMGDSRIYLIRNGAAIQINREHTYAVELDEKAATGDVSWEAAQGDARRGALTSYLGMGEPEKVDRNIRPVKLLGGDRIVLMSDGVFGVLTDDEIMETMELLPHDSAARLQDMVLSRSVQHQDNFTVLVFEYNS